jgi:hypothetical protein
MARYARALGWHWVIAVAAIYFLSQALRTSGDFVLAQWSATSSSTSSNDDDGNDDDDDDDDGDSGTDSGWLNGLVSTLLSTLLAPSSSSSSSSSKSSNDLILGLEPHLFLYAMCLFASSLLVLARALVLVAANVRACQKVHDRALWAVLRSPMGKMMKTKMMMIKKMMINKVDGSSTCLIISS